MELNRHQNDVDLPCLYTRIDCSWPNRNIRDCFESCATLKNHVLNSERLRTPKEEGHLAQVKVDKVFGFVGYVTSIPLTHDGMPSRTEFLIHGPLDVACHVLLNAKLFQCVVRDFDGFRLHVFGHVDILDDGLETPYVATRLGGERRSGRR